MQKYIAILRGINVSGQKLIKMAELKIHLEELEFKNVSSYIQSGNILFESKNQNQKVLATEIENKIREKYGWDVPVIVKNSDELKTISERNPFLINRNEDFKKLYVIFLDDEPEMELIENFKKTDYLPDEFVLSEKTIYAFYTNSYGTTKFTNNYFEKKLKTKATTRNWNTVLKLLELSTIT
ncbi:MAG: DUF1697 domain-containing protein [Bacteroidia bacterium]